MNRVEKEGYKVIVIIVDVFVRGKRRKDMRNNFYLIFYFMILFNINLVKEEVVKRLLNIEEGK